MAFLLEQRIFKAGEDIKCRKRDCARVITKGTKCIIQRIYFPPMELFIELCSSCGGQNLREMQEAVMIYANKFTEGPIYQAAISSVRPGVKEDPNNKLT
jgi:hypothetical protein